MAFNWDKFFKTENLKEKIKSDLVKYKISLKKDEMKKLLGENMTKEIPDFLKTYFYELTFIQFCWSVESNQQSGDFYFAELGGQTFVEFEGDGGPLITEAGPFAMPEEAAKFYEGEFSPEILDSDDEVGEDLSTGYCFKHASFSEERAIHLTKIICGE